MNKKYEDKTKITLKSTMRRVLTKGKNKGKEVPITHKYKLDPKSTKTNKIWIPE